MCLVESFVTPSDINKAAILVICDFRPVVRINIIYCKNYTRMPCLLDNPDLIQFFLLFRITGNPGGLSQKRQTVEKEQ